MKTFFTMISEYKSRRKAQVFPSPAKLVFSIAFLPSVLSLLFIAAASGCGKKSTENSAEMAIFSGPTMGSTYTVKVVAEAAFTEAEKKAIADAIEGVLSNINNLMSTYRDDSELSRFNQHREETPFPVSPETLEVFQLAERISTATQGAFDVTVSPLVELWGFGRNKKPEGYVPSSEEIERTKSAVGYQKIVVDALAGTLTKRHPDVVCDVGAIVPGYASDKVAEALERLGYTNYMVEIGGEVRARGRNLDGRIWRIGIEKPDELGRVVQKVVPLENAALSTSGDYRNYFEKDGKRYCHEIDPRTGKPIEHNLASVSVITSDCASADAYATALMVVGPIEGKAFADTHDLAAYFLVRQTDGHFEEVESAAFTSYMEKVTPQIDPGER